MTDKLPPTRAEEIRIALEQEILTGGFAPGQRLDEQELAQRYAASRTPVREALRSLEARQMITWEPRRGPTIRVLGLGEILDMFQVMAELEGLCARLAARRGSPAEVRDLERLHDICAQSAGRSDEAQFYDDNKAWHQRIYEMSNNPFLRRQTEELRLRVAPYRRFITRQAGRMATSIDEHARVLAAIRARDDERAHAEMRDHVAILGYEVTDWMQSLNAVQGIVERDLKALASRV